MSKIKINTLTMVHIGSGNLLQNDTDFVIHESDEDMYLSVIDPNKMLNFIGIDHINDWILSIEKGTESTKALVNRFSKNTNPSKYSKRDILCFARNIKAKDTLKECIHNGMGVPYIPGSSIKGAIRTAVLASLCKEKEQEHLTNQIKDNKRKVNAKRVESELFGSDPNSDVFRFLQVGDAYFDKGSEIATRMINLNIRERNNLLDSSKPQLIEAIGLEEESEFQLKLSTDYYEWAKKNWNYKKELGSLPLSLSSIQMLFSTINAHTKQLLQDEIELWNNVSEEYVGATDYIDKMKELFDIANHCKEGKECVLRIGHGSGWRFITGAWTEDFDNFDSVIVPESRPNNRRYEQYDFPKSRRIDEDSDILGFVKLSLA